jgi:hypothetical protein
VAVIDHPHDWLAAKSLVDAHAYRRRGAKMDAIAFVAPAAICRRGVTSSRIQKARPCVATTMSDP